MSSDRVDANGINLDGELPSGKNGQGRVSNQKTRDK